VTLVIAESAPGAGDDGSILLKNNLNEVYNTGIDEIGFDDATVWTPGGSAGDAACPGVDGW
jgi:hypothetical protein